MTFVRCLHCEDTFQHTQEARHSAEKHPAGFPARHVASDARASVYQKETK